MFATPDDTPVTTPVLKLIVAVAGEPEFHAPPGVALDNVIVVPEQTLDGPVIAAGTGLTVTSAVREHPVESVYVIVDVPAPMPVTTPVPDTEATAPSLLAHVPPVGVLDKEVVSP